MQSNMTERERILVIRFGALGDIIMCRQAFHEIRQAHKDAEIILLTTPPFEALTKTMPWFDRVISAERASVLQIHKWVDLVLKLSHFAPHRVYDLQGKFRQSMIYMLLGGPLWGPEWSGAAPGCSHPRLWPPQSNMHFVDFLAAQLRRANVPAAPPADMSWLDAPIEELNSIASAAKSPARLRLGEQPRPGQGLGEGQSTHDQHPPIGTSPPSVPPASGREATALPEKFALLIPGCSPKLLHKRWPAENYAKLAKRLQEKGIASIAIGTKTEADTITALRQQAPDVIDFCGQTNLYQLATLARRATYTIGNDTGPMHLAAAVGSPTLAILSGHTNPIWSAPYGPKTAWVKADPITKVTVDEVFLALTGLTATN